MAKRKLVSGDDAAECLKQPTSACSDCPWGRESLPGWLGSLSADEWLRVAHGESTVECHALKSPEGEPWTCAGLAQYRANVAKKPRAPDALILPPNREAVFANPMEFKDHHAKKEALMSSEDKFAQIAEEAVRRAEKVECSLEEFGEGLETMIGVLQERRQLVREESGS